jgi:hypothetical protein
VGSGKIELALETSRAILDRQTDLRTTTVLLRTEETDPAFIGEIEVGSMFLRTDMEKHVTELLPVEPTAP